MTCQLGEVWEEDGIFGWIIVGNPRKILGRNCVLMMFLYQLHDYRQINHGKLEQIPTSFFKKVNWKRVG